MNDPWIYDSTCEVEQLVRVLPIATNDRYPLVKLALNFMTSYLGLVFISCLQDMIKNAQLNKYEKNDIICSYRGKKIKFWIPYILDFPISPLATSLKGEFPLINKGMPVCDNPMYFKSNYIETFVGDMHSMAFFVQ